jgi:hypothetical protein
MASSIMRVYFANCDKYGFTKEALMGNRVKLTSMAKAAG